MIALPPLLAARLAAELKPGAVAKLLAGALGLLAVFLAGMRVEHWRGEAKYSALVATHAEAEARAQREARERERGWLAALEAVERNDAARNAEIDRRLAAALRERDRLRDAYAAYRSRTTADPAPIAESADAGTVRRLLGEAERLAAEGASLAAELDELAGACVATAERRAARLTAFQEYSGRVLGAPRGSR